MSSVPLAERPMQSASADTRRFHNLVDGELAGSDRFYEVQNPSTLEIVGLAPASTAHDVDLAVAAARRAGPAWAADLDARRAALRAMADTLDAHVDELAELLSREQGKPMANARTECGYSARFLRYYADLDQPGEVIRETPNHRVRSVRAPIGVVGLIVPWNVPLGLLHFKLAAALAAGNTVVAKPAPSTPLATLRYFELLADVLPHGVINSVTGHAEVGAALVAHPEVSKISLTGSVATGRIVMAGAASTLKRLTLELGGNDAAILLDDIDPAALAPRIFAHAFGNCGQICMAIKRLYVHERHYDETVARLTEFAAQMVVGDGLQPGVQMGPLHNRAQYDIVTDLIEDARAHGATIHGGGPVEGHAGHFLRPAIVTGLRRDARLVREEQFGPVLPVLPFSDERAVIAEANAVEVGLTGSVWSKDPARASALALGLEVGTIFVNSHGGLPDPEIPFGGIKQSGFGHELYRWGLDDFSIRKVLSETF